MMAALHSTAHAYIDIVPDICTLTCTFAWLEVRIVEVQIIKVGLYLKITCRDASRLLLSLVLLFAYFLVLPSLLLFI